MLNTKIGRGQESGSESLHWPPAPFSFLSLFWGRGGGAQSLILRPAIIKGLGRLCFSLGGKMFHRTLNLLALYSLNTARRAVDPGNNPNVRNNMGLKEGKGRSTFPH